jgi:hypothetical protein
MSMYGRGMAPQAGNVRLNEMLDNIRAEFETQRQAGGEYEHQSTLFRHHAHLHLNSHAAQSVQNGLLTLSSRPANAGDADGTGECLSNGTNTPRVEAKVCQPSNYPSKH